MKKKFQLIALSVILVAVIVGGIWLLTRSPGEKAPEAPDSPVASQPNMPQPGVSTKEPVAITEPVTRLIGYNILRHETQDVLNQYGDYLRDFSLITGKFAFLTWSGKTREHLGQRRECRLPPLVRC